MSSPARTLPWFRVSFSNGEHIKLQAISITAAVVTAHATAGDLSARAALQQQPPVRVVGVAEMDAAMAKAVPA